MEYEEEKGHAWEVVLEAGCFKSLNPRAHGCQLLPRSWRP